MINRVLETAKLLFSPGYLKRYPLIIKWVESGSLPDGFIQTDPQAPHLLADIAGFILKAPSKQSKMALIEMFVKIYNWPTQIIHRSQEGEAAKVLQKRLLPTLQKLEQWVARFDDAAGRGLYFRLLNSILATCLPESVDLLVNAIRANRLPHALPWVDIFKVLQDQQLMADRLRLAFAKELPPEGFFPCFASMDSDPWYVPSLRVLDRPEAEAGIRRWLEIPERTRQLWISEERINWHYRVYDICGRLPQLTQPWAAKLIQECLESPVIEIKHAMAAHLLKSDPGDPRAVDILQEICPLIALGTLANDRSKRHWEVCSLSINRPGIYGDFLSPGDVSPPPRDWKLIWEHNITLPRTETSHHFYVYRVRSELASGLEGTQEVFFVSDQQATSSYVMTSKTDRRNEPHLEDLLYVHLAAQAYDYLIFPVDAAVKFTLSLLPSHLLLLQNWPGEPLEHASVTFVLDCAQLRVDPLGVPPVLLVAEATVHGEPGFAIIEGGEGENPRVLRHFWQPRSTRPDKWGAKLAALEHVGRMLAGKGPAHQEVRRKDGPLDIPVADDVFLELFQRHVNWAEHARLGVLNRVSLNVSDEPIHRNWTKFAKLMRQRGRISELMRVARLFASVITKGQEGFCCLLSAEFDRAGEKAEARAVFHKGELSGKEARGHYFGREYLWELCLACWHTGEKEESLKFLRKHITEYKTAFDEACPMNLADRFFLRERYASNVAGLAVILDEDMDACMAQLKAWELPPRI